MFGILRSITEGYKIHWQGSYPTCAPSSIAMALQKWTGKNFNEVDIAHFMQQVDTKGRLLPEEPPVDAKGNLLRDAKGNLLPTRKRAFMSGIAEAVNKFGNEYGIHAAPATESIGKAGDIDTLKAILSRPGAGPTIVAIKEPGTPEMVPNSERTLLQRGLGLNKTRINNYHHAIVVDYIVKDLATGHDVIAIRDPREGAYFMDDKHFIGLWK